MRHYKLQRFIDAQEHSFEIALKEIKNGKKTSHWMWFIFPQYKGLGRSEISIKYSIKSKEEAIAYIEDDILGNRLIEICEALLKIENKTVSEIFGSPDNLKLKSSMSLFTLIQNENNVFQNVLDKYFDGKISYRTRKLLNNN